MSVLDFFAELFGAATARGFAEMVKDGNDDPVYKAKLQELIERNKAFEAEAAEKAQK